MFFYLGKLVYFLTINGPVISKREEIMAKS